jgi:hypothetical protein
MDGMKSTHIQNEYAWQRVGLRAGLSELKFRRWVILVAAMMVCAYSNAQSSPPSIEDTVGVNVNFQDFFPLLNSSNNSCTTNGCTFFRNTGIQYIRTDLNWQQLETTKGTVDFTNCAKTTYTGSANNGGWPILRALCEGWDSRLPAQSDFA